MSCFCCYFCNLMLSQEVGTFATSPAAILGPGDLRRWTGHFSWRLCDRLIAVGFTKIWASSLVLSEFVVKDHRFFLAMASSSLTVSHCQGSESTNTKTS